MKTQEKYYKLIEIIAALSLARDTLRKNIYTIGLFIGPCTELEHTQQVLMQLNSILGRNPENGD